MTSEQSDTQSQEFERQPVPASYLKNWKSFLGMYAGEHAAGTEFMIGPLFLTAGVSAFDLIVGFNEMLQVPVDISKKPFLLISSGTWSISLNPFSQETLTREDLQNDCLSFLRIDGKPVRASRLFLGAEYRFQTEQLQRHYNKEHGYHRKIAFNVKIHSSLMENYQRFFKFEQIQSKLERPDGTNFDGFPTFEVAYHQLMLELMELQVQSIKRAIGNSKITRIYVDGGFADNRIYVKTTII